MILWSRMKHFERIIGNVRRLSSGKDEINLNFEDHKNAFEHKSAAEIVRSLLLLRICSVNLFVDNSLKVMLQAKMLVEAYSCKCTLYWSCESFK